MFGLIKKIFSRSERSAAAYDERPRMRSSHSAPPAPRVEKPRYSSKSTPPAPAVPAAPPATSGDCVCIEVSSMLPKLPDDVRGRIVSRAGLRMAIPVELVVPQLSQGVVSLPLGELRTLAPDVFSNVANHDEVAVTLPLEEVLKQLKPSQYPRRSGQRKITVPDEVAGLFGEKGQRITISTEPLKPQGKSDRATPPSVAPSQRVAPAPVSAPAPVPAPAPIAMPKPLAPPPAAVKAPQTLPGLPTIPVSRPVTPAPMPKLPQPQPSIPRAPSAVGGEALRVALAELCQGWAQEIQAEIAALNIGQAVVALPIDAIEQGLKSGQLLFSWKQVCSWLTPSVTPAAPAVGELPVELPLKVVAPMFMALYRPGASQRKAEVGENIPDVFGKGGTPHWGAGVGSSSTPSGPSSVGSVPLPTTRVVALPAGTTAPRPPSQPAPAKAPISMPAPGLPRPAAPAAPAAPAVPQFNLEALIGPATGRFAAKTIVSNAAKLPGVSGAMLVMSDGLLVTSELPPAIKGEVVAAFLPQMFGRMNQYVRELNMGGLRCLSLTVDGGSWQVIKQPGTYFALLCEPDKPLPLQQLTAVAEELNKQQQ